MSAFEAFPAFSPHAPEPVPAAYAEPLERLAEAFSAGMVVLLLHVADDVPTEWLSAERVAVCLRTIPLEPVQARAWPLLPQLWAVSLTLQGDPGEAGNTATIHILCRALAESLDADWRTGAPLPLPDLSAFGLPSAEPRSFSEDIRPILVGTNRPAGQPTAFTLTPVAPIPSMEGIQDNIAELNALLEIIVNKQLHAQFQPIVNLRDGQVIGYEALIRGPKGTQMRRGGQMFHAADKARMVSWYDVACQERCFALAAQQGLKHLLFINMDAEGLSFLDTYDRSLALRAREVGLTPAGIVVEITERQTVGDFPQLAEYIGRLREEGFKIAIDDAGAGYNSLHAIAELRPEFVKVDRNMVRNLDAHGERRALLAALVDYTRHIGTAVLAEGSETYEELATLIDLGVSYGQGYLMGKPQDDFRGVAKPTREFIKQRAVQRAVMLAGRMATVGGLARTGLAMPPDTPLAVAAKHFAKEESLTSVVVVEDGYARGLLMRDKLAYVLDMASAANVGALLPDETIAQWMQTNVLFADEDAPANEIARQVTTRGDIRLEADIVIVRGDRHYVGVLPARTLLEAATTIQENRQRYADPLTGLPGRIALEEVLRERLEERRPLAVLRTDIGRLEPFNRRYGVAHGDAMIQAVARLLQETSAAKGRPDDFLAHLGGDDFVLLTEGHAAEDMCRALVEGFPKLLSSFYTAEQLRLGFIEVETSGGGVRRVPLASLSVAAQTNRTRRLTHYAQVMDGLNALLRFAQSQPGSSYVIDNIPPRMNANKRE